MGDGTGWPGGEEVGDGPLPVGRIRTSWHDYKITRGEENLEGVRWQGREKERENGREGTKGRKGRQGGKERKGRKEKEDKKGEGRKGGSCTLKCSAPPLSVIHHHCIPQCSQFKSGGNVKV